MENPLIYLDNAATTPLATEALEAMLPFFKEQYFNAHSGHLAGLLVADEVENCRKNIASLLGASPKHLIFTSGATEGLELVLSQVRGPVISAKTEHTAVLNVLKNSETFWLTVDKDGQIDLGQIEDKLKNGAQAVCLMWVNNETGVQHGVSAIGKLCHQYGAFFVIDATQAVGKIPVDFTALNTDALVFSGHKFHGPKGIGGVLMSDRLQKRFRIKNPSVERGLRSGTLNVPAIVGMAAALALPQKNTEEMASLQGYFEKEILNKTSGKIVGQNAIRSPYISTVFFSGIDSEAALGAMGGICVSNGSACSIKKTEPSHVFQAMGYSYSDAQSCLRFSFSRYTSYQELDFAINKLEQIVV